MSEVSNEELQSADGGRHTYQILPGQTVSEAVVVAVAEATGRDRIPTGAADEGDRAALDPLYEAIDPDALNALFRSNDEETRLTGTVSFPYCGYEVTVDGTDRVILTEL